jgi:hypothetical protein
VSALAALIAALALFAEAEPSAPGAAPAAPVPAAPAARPPEGSEAANAARAEAGLLPRKRPGRAREARLGTEVVPATALVAAAAPPPRERRGWLAAMVDAARALDPGEPAAAAPATAPAAAIEDVRARALGLRVEGRLTVRVGGVMLGGASTSEPPRQAVRAAATADDGAAPTPARSDAP